MSEDDADTGWAEATGPIEPTVVPGYSQPPPPAFDQAPSLANGGSGSSGESRALAAEALIQVVRGRGRGDALDPSRLRGLLNDCLGVHAHHCRDEVNTLVAVARTGAAERLVAERDANARGDLTARLIEAGIPDATAGWGIDTWISALASGDGAGSTDGLITEHNPILDRGPVSGHVSYGVVPDGVVPGKDDHTPVISEASSKPQRWVWPAVGALAMLLVVTTVVAIQQRNRAAGLERELGSEGNERSRVVTESQSEIEGANRTIADMQTTIDGLNDTVEGLSGQLSVAQGNAEVTGVQVGRLIDVVNANMSGGASEDMLAQLGIGTTGLRGLGQVVEQVESCTGLNDCDSWAPSNLPRLVTSCTDLCQVSSHIFGSSTPLFLDAGAWWASGPTRVFGFTCDGVDDPTVGEWALKIVAHGVEADGAELIVAGAEYRLEVSLPSDTVCTDVHLVYTGTMS